MTLYDIIYDFFLSTIFQTSSSLDNINCEINGETLAMCEWLSHTASIITIVLLVVCCGLFIRWIFKVISGAILLK